MSKLEITGIVEQEGAGDSHRHKLPAGAKLRASMDHFAELDVSVKETSVCKIVREVKVASEP